MNIAHTMMAIGAFATQRHFTNFTWEIIGTFSCHESFSTPHWEYSPLHTHLAPVVSHSTIDFKSSLCYQLAAGWIGGGEKVLSTFFGLAWD